MMNSRGVGIDWKIDAGDMLLKQDAESTAALDSGRQGSLGIDGVEVGRWLGLVALLPKE
jgi:hypothetical protein